MYHFTLKFSNKYVGAMSYGYTLNVSSSQMLPDREDIRKALINAGFSKYEAENSLIQIFGLNKNSRHNRKIDKVI